MKTKDAFAFRDFYYYCFKSTDEETIKAFNFFFDFESKGYARPHWLKPEYASRLDDFIGAIENFKYSLKRKEMLVNLLQNHLRRLNQLLGNVLEQSFDRSADENLQKKITRLNFLNKAYKEILSTLRGSLNSDATFLHKQRESFRRAMREEFGQRLRTARKFKGYTGVELAKWLGISQTSYSEYERGKTEPPLSTIYTLAKKLNVTADYLLCMDR